MNKYIKLSLILIFTFFHTTKIIGWGSVGHTLINRNTTIHFPIEMTAFKSWSNYLALHGSDADYRKSSDPTEGPKHYIDIDNYQEFISGNMVKSYDSLVAIYGSAFVLNQGILPWATVTTFDSLTATIQRRDWNKAMQFAADLGHYVGDGHQPLHITKNYDGQLTNQRGVHARYEIDMINKYQSEFTFTIDSVRFVSSVLDFVFDYLTYNYSNVQDILKADSIAYATAGNTSSQLYYSTLWNYSKTFTKDLWQRASLNLASLIYSAWVKAGQPSLPTEVISELSYIPNQVTLFQNYPNPFNYSTQIRYYIPSDLANQLVTLKVRDTLGQEISTLINEIQDSGHHQYEFDAKRNKLTSGIYFFELQVGNYSDVKKMNYVK